MKFNSDEIASVLQAEIEQFENKVDVREVGTVLEVGDGIARVYGLSGVMAGEMVQFPNDAIGLAFNLEENSVGVIILGDYLTIQEGDEVRALGTLLSVPAGDAVVGRVLDPLGNPLDGKGPVQSDITRPGEIIAAGIMGRKPVHEPLQTGIKAIDAMTPIGRGQRELIIGDRKTGKTTVAIDTILNQQGLGVKCIYVAVGQKSSTVAQTVDTLRQAGAMDYTVVVVASASDPAPFKYLAPYAGCAIGQHWMDNGEHALVVYDDLSKQADAYRQLSLLLRRPPGREAYPGDVFYLHSRLLERAAKLNEELGGGSMTALPIVETKANDVSAFIPTNVISITDGQIFLETDLFYQGVRPAMNAGVSVSRVGGAAQRPAMKKVSGTVRLELAQFRELEAFAQFGSDLDKASQQQIARGQRVVEILKQPQYEPLSVQLQVASVVAVTSGVLDELPVVDVSRFESELHTFLRDRHAGLLGQLATEKLSDELNQQLRTAVSDFAAGFSASHVDTVDERNESWEAMSSTSETVE